MLATQPYGVLAGQQWPFASHESEPPLHVVFATGLEQELPLDPLLTPPPLPVPLLAPFPLPLPPPPEGGSEGLQAF
jgi:hypothetical protein